MIDAGCTACPSERMPGHDTAIRRADWAAGSSGGPSALPDPVAMPMRLPGIGWLVTGPVNCVTGSRLEKSPWRCAGVANYINAAIKGPESQDRLSPVSLRTTPAVQMAYRLLE